MQEPCLLVGIWAGVRGLGRPAGGRKNVWFSFDERKGGGELGCGAFGAQLWSCEAFQARSMGFVGHGGTLLSLCAGAAAPTPNRGRLPALVLGIPACMRFAPRAAELLFVQGEPFIW